VFFENEEYNLNEPIFPYDVVYLHSRHLMWFCTQIILQRKELRVELLLSNIPAELMGGSLDKAKVSGYFLVGSRRII
jgi:hypothetical protein